MKSKGAVLVLVAFSHLKCAGDTTPPSGNPVADSTEQLYSAPRYLHTFRPSFAVVRLETVAPQAQWQSVAPYLSRQRTQALVGERITYGAPSPTGNMAVVNWYRSTMPGEDFNGSYGHSTPVVGSQYLVSVGPDPWIAGEFAVGHAFVLDEQSRTRVPIYGVPAGSAVSEVLSFVRHEMATNAADAGIGDAGR